MNRKAQWAVGRNGHVAGRLSAGNAFDLQLDLNEPAYGLLLLAFRLDHAHSKEPRLDMQ